MIRIAPTGTRGLLIHLILLAISLSVLVIPFIVCLRTGGLADEQKKN